MISNTVKKKADALILKTIAVVLVWKTVSYKQNKQILRLIIIYSKKRLHNEGKKKPVKNSPAHY